MQVSVRDGKGGGVDQEYGESVNGGGNDNHYSGGVVSGPSETTEEGRLMAAGVEGASHGELRDGPVVTGPSEGSNHCPGTEDGGEDKRVEEFFAKYHVRNFLALVLIGIINHIHYNLVLSASHQMAVSFRLEKYIAVITWANVIGGFFVRLINAFVYPKMTYLKRFLFAGLMTIVGVAFVCFAPYCGHNNTFKFFLLLLGVFNVGNGNHYGESVVLGYLERYPSKMIGGWATGTGISGVFVGFFFIGLKTLGLNLSIIFGSSLIFVLLFWYSFYYVLVLPHKTECGTYEPRSNVQTLSWSSGEIKRQTIGFALESVETNESAMTALTALTAGGQREGQPGAQESNTRQKRIRAWWNSDGMVKMRYWHNYVLFNNVNLMLVYLFEYAIQFIVPFCFPCETYGSSNFWLKNSFVISQLCYQIGVMISRSSLGCVRIHKVWVLTLLQFINLIGWLTQAKTLMLSDKDDPKGPGQLKYAFILFGWSIFVGLMGGASYVNVFHNILVQTMRGEEKTDKLILKERRQLCMNIGAFYQTIGVSLGCLLDIVFSNVILTRKC